MKTAGNSSSYLDLDKAGHQSSFEDIGIVEHLSSSEDSERVENSSSFEDSGIAGHSSSCSGIGIVVRLNSSEDSGRSCLRTRSNLSSGLHLGLSFAAGLKRSPSRIGIRLLYLFVRQQVCLCQSDRSNLQARGGLGRWMASYCQSLSNYSLEN